MAFWCCCWLVGERRKDCLETRLIAAFFCRLVTDWLALVVEGTCAESNFSLNYSFLKIALTDFLEFLLTAIGSSIFLRESNIFLALIISESISIADSYLLMILGKNCLKYVMYSFSNCTFFAFRCTLLIIC